MLDVPIWHHGEMVGVVCHEHVGPKREWTEAEQDFAAAVADTISRAMEAAERAGAERLKASIICSVAASKAPSTAAPQVRQT